jgi:hypothetical protein
MYAEAIAQARTIWKRHVGPDARARRSSTVTRGQSSASANAT